LNFQKDLELAQYTVLGEWSMEPSGTFGSSPNNWSEAGTWMGYYPSNSRLPPIIKCESIPRPKPFLF